jgi:hypothetical protein
MTSCDDLFWMSGGFSLSGFPSGDESDLLAFARTCGGRTDQSAAGWCDYTDGEGFRSACESGDMFACDQLYFNTEAGSEDEAVGATCGGRSRVPMDGLCEETFGSSVP